MPLEISIFMIFPAKPVEAGNYDKLRVGDVEENRSVVTTNQILSPLGEQITFPSRPTAVALSPNRRWLGVLCHNKVLLIDIEKKEIKGSSAISRRTSRCTTTALSPSRAEPTTCR